MTQTVYELISQTEESENLNYAQWAKLVELADRISKSMSAPLQKHLFVGESALEIASIDPDDIQNADFSDFENHIDHLESRGADLQQVWIAITEYLRDLEFQG